MKPAADPKHPKRAEKQPGKADAALDEALEETFPASDPPAVGHTDHVGAPPSHSGTRAPGQSSPGKTKPAGR